MGSASEINGLIARRSAKSELSVQDAGRLVELLAQASQK
jgi:hypothetical protein